MATTRLRSKGQLTIPPEARRAAHIAEGDVIEVEVVEGEGIMLRPKKLVDASQAWFWTDGWQTRVRRSVQEIEAGLGERFESDEEFLAALDDK